MGDNVIAEIEISCNETWDIFFVNYVPLWECFYLLLYILETFWKYEMGWYHPEDIGCGWAERCT
jgi:hypothetical protein